MGQAAWIGNAAARRSILEILLGALLLVVDNLRVHLLCLCSFVCGGDAGLMHLLYGGLILVDHGS